MRENPYETDLYIYVDKLTFEICVYSNNTTRIYILRTREDKDRDSFIGPQEFVVGYSKAPEQPQSSARPICHSHITRSTGREPATIRIAAYRSSPHYARDDDGDDAKSTVLPSMEYRNLRQ